MATVQKSSTGGVYVDPKQYGADPNKLQGGEAVQGQAGKVWKHETVQSGGGGWYVGDPDAPAGSSGAPGSTGGGGPSGPLPPSPVASQPPIPGGPAPQIPLGPTSYDTGHQLNPTGSGTDTTGQPATTGTTRTLPNGQVVTTATPDQQAGVSGMGPNDVLTTQVRQALMGLLGQDVNAASTTDADIAPQSQAYAAAVQRQAGQQRAELAERSAAEGTLNSGAFQGGTQAISQQAGQSIGANDASLIGQKLDARRQQLQQAIQVSSSMGMAEETNNLQRQLANLDAQLKTRDQNISVAGQGLQRDLANLDTNTKTYLAQLDAQLTREGRSQDERLAIMQNELQRYGINANVQLGELDNALKRELGTGQLNLGLLQTLLQNNQVNNRLGFDIGSTQAQLNNQAILAALGR